MLSNEVVAQYWNTSKAEKYPYPTLKSIIKIFFLEIWRTDGGNYEIMAREDDGFLARKHDADANGGGYVYQPDQFPVS